MYNYNDNGEYTYVRNARLTYSLITITTLFQRDLHFPDLILRDVRGVGIVRNEFDYCLNLK